MNVSEVCNLDNSGLPLMVAQEIRSIFQEFHGDCGTGMVNHENNDVRPRELISWCHVTDQNERIKHWIEFLNANWKKKIGDNQSRPKLDTVSSWTPL